MSVIINNISYEYIINADKKSCTIARAILSGDVMLPKKIGNLTVTEIDVGAFVTSKTLTSVTVPSTIDIIRFSAFGRCPALKAVIFNGNNNKNGLNNKNGNFDASYNDIFADGFGDDPGCTPKSLIVYYNKNATGFNKTFSNRMALSDTMLHIPLIPKTEYNITLTNDMGDGMKEYVLSNNNKDQVYTLDVSKFCKENVIYKITVVPFNKSLRLKKLENTLTLKDCNEILNFNVTIDKNMIYSWMENYSIINKYLIKYKYASKPTQVYKIPQNEIVIKNNVLSWEDKDNKLISSDTITENLKNWKNYSYTFSVDSDYIDNTIADSTSFIVKA